METNRQNKSSRWYIEKFQSQYVSLLSLKDTASGDERNRIEDTLKILHNFMYEESSEDLIERASLSTRLKIEDELFDEIRDFVGLAELLVKYGNIEIKYSYIPSPNLSDEEFLTIVHDFYKTCTDKDIYKLYRAIYKRRKNLLHMTHLMERNPSPKSIYIPYGNKTHIRLKRYNTFEDIFDLVHEYGHGIHFSTNFDMAAYGENYLFVEITSTFFELLCMEYLSTISSFGKCTQNIREKMYNRAVKRNRYFLLEEAILDLWNELKREKASKIIQKLNREYDNCFIGNPNLGIVDMLNRKIANEFIYVVGYVFAIEFLEQYKKDRDWGLYLLKNLMAIDWRLPMEDYYEQILQLGITPNEHLEDYKKYVITAQKKG